ncbi:MAG: hypothetical protein K2H49_02160, partial [Muribaculaceae bacterium]|nr:hypothetical protein [Muribaculaceae bacterium]
FKAWGNPTTFDVEIAGIRIGNVFIESGLEFTKTPNVSYSKTDYTQNGQWVTPQTLGVVEYIYQEGESVIQIKNGGNYTTSGKATSLMGKAGSALVIPASYSNWQKNKTHTGLYFGVLLRVKDIGGMQLYPYIEGANMNASTTTAQMNVVYLAVNKTSGRINKRLYKKDDGYYTDQNCDPDNLYTPNDAEEVRDYAWAAFPFSTTSSTKANWKSGCQFTYTLGFSSGVGYEDPADPFPGKPIIWDIQPNVSVEAFQSGGENDVTDQITIIP